MAMTRTEALRKLLALGELARDEIEKTMGGDREDVAQAMAELSSMGHMTHANVGTGSRVYRVTESGRAWLSMSKENAHTVAYIRERCEEVGDCWIWQKGVQSAGLPQAKIKGRTTLLVRRVMMQACGIAVAPGQMTGTRCEDKKCLNPAHLFATTHSAAGKAAAARGAWTGLARRAKIAAAKRSTVAKLDMEKARAIRESSGPAHIQAAIYGVNKSVITGIRAGTRWREYTPSPFAGLGQRVA